jgi:hypothetical protein
VAPTPSERHTSSRRIGACASWVVLWRWTGRLTHPPFAGSRSRLTNPRDGGCGCRHGRYVERVREWRAWPQLTPLGSRRRRRPHPPPFLCNCVHDSTASACGQRAPRRETDTAYGRAAAFGVEAPGTTEFPRRSSMSMQGQGPASRGRVGHGGALRGDPLASDRAFPLCRATGASWPPQWRSRAIA